MKRRFEPPLDKTKIAALDGLTVYAVRALAVRNAAQPDEEFGNFAVRPDFPDLIADREVWVADRLTDREAGFFLANARVQYGELARGRTDEHAYQSGLDAERELRERATGIPFRDGKPHKQVPDETYLRPYTTLPDPKGPVAVWRVDGMRVRCTYKTDSTEGGHGYVYPWVPRPEIWVEEAVEAAEVPYILAHEYTERRLMRDEGMGYDPAHEVAARVEFGLRKAPTRRRFPGFGPEPPTKANLPALTAPEYYEYVLKHYVRG
jgi:hypothetical protein